jgi:hypothetical protein
MNTDEREFGNKKARIEDGELRMGTEPKHQTLNTERRTSKDQA